MTARLPEPLERLTFDAATLMAEHPPMWRHTNKLVVYTVGCPEGCVHSGTIGYTRWPAIELPTSADPAAAVERAESRPTIYDYEPVAEGAVEWHVNFADPLLFYAYGSGLFAQDEMQSAEHPALGAIVEALHVGSQRPVTEDQSGPTPVLVTGVERRVHVATDRNEAEGRPRGLYGNEFSAASPDVVRRAARRIEPPTRSNIIALAAPAYGIGRYTREQLERILITAYTGFAAAVHHESDTLSAGAPVVIHTGYWGCGVFGGNRIVMSLLQVVAAGMAGADKLVFHTVTEEGAEPFEEALRVTDEELGQGEIAVGDLLDRLVALDFRWGMSECC